MHFFILWYKAKEILRKKKEKEKSITPKERIAEAFGVLEVFDFLPFLCCA
jgi:hypothetical protein